MKRSNQSKLLGWGLLVAILVGCLILLTRPSREGFQTPSIMTTLGNGSNSFKNLHLQTVTVTAPTAPNLTQPHGIRLMVAPAALQFMFNEYDTATRASAANVYSDYKLATPTLMLNKLYKYFGTYNVARQGYLNLTKSMV